MALQRFLSSSLKRYFSLRPVDARKNKNENVTLNVEIFKKGKGGTLLSLGFKVAQNWGQLATI